MRRYRIKKFYSWNSNIAYLAGLIAADGCLSINRRHINVTSKDLELIESVRAILDSSAKVSTKANGFGGYSNFIQFSDVALYDFLFRAGITPAKSRTIVKVEVPDEFFGDFLRGLFDGDGTVYGFWDPRWRCSLMYYTGFASASPAFLRWLSKNNQRLAGTTAGKVEKGIRVSTLTYAKADSLKLFTLMYGDGTVYSLGRKRDKFIDFIKSDPYAGKELLGRVL